jgi:hypothetical protein
MSDEYLSLSGADPRAVRPTFHVAGAVRATLTTLSSNLAPIFLLTLLAHLPVLVGGWILQDEIWIHPRPTGFLLYLFFAGISGQLAAAFLTVAVFRFLRGKKIGLLECLKTGFRKAPAAFLTGIFVSVATTLGFVLCLVPGIMAAMMLSVAVPATIVESAGPFTALQRSRDLTAGNRWTIFALFILAGLVVQVPAQIGALFLRPYVPVFVIWTLATSVVAGAFSAVLSCVLYYQLREEKEDLDVADLAAVFD